jgi:hypothetical protein
MTQLTVISSSTLIIGTRTRPTQCNKTTCSRQTSYYEFIPCSDYFRSHERNHFKFVVFLILMVIQAGFFRHFDSKSKSKSFPPFRRTILPPRCTFRCNLNILQNGDIWSRQQTTNIFHVIKKYYLNWRKHVEKTKIHYLYAYTPRRKGDTRLPKSRLTYKLWNEFQTIQAFWGHTKNLRKISDPHSRENEYDSLLKCCIVQSRRS